MKSLVAVKQTILVLHSRLIRLKLSHNYHIETSTLVCTSNQETGFYMIMSSIMKDFK